MRPAWNPLVVIFVAALFMPTTSATPFLQLGYDAGRTGLTSDPGPADFDVALRHVVSGVFAPASVPVLIGEAAFVITRPGCSGSETASCLATQGTGNGEDALVRIDTRTGAVQRLGDPFASPPRSIASDGSRIFVTHPDAVRAYAPTDASVLWETPYGGTDSPTNRRIVSCDAPAVAETRLYVACTWHEEGIRVDGPAPAEVLPYGFRAGGVYAAAFDLETGEIEGSWDSNVDPSLSHPVPCVHSFGIAVTGRLVALVCGGRNLDPSSEQAALTDETTMVVLGFDHEFQPLWDYQLRTSSSDSARLAGDPSLLATPDFVVVYGDQLVVLDAETGQEEHVLMDGADRPRGVCEISQVPCEVAFGGPMAFDGRRLFVGGHGRLLAFEVDDSPERLWEIPFSGSWGISAGFSLADNLLYGPTSDGKLYVIDVNEQSVRAEVMPLTPQAGLVAGVGEGMAVVLLDAGEFAIVGRTGLGILPSLGAVDQYPAVGHDVTVDLTASRPGLLDPRLQVRVDWGDGQATDWGPAGVVTHAFALAGNFTATFRFRNAPYDHVTPYQEAVETVVFHVGGTPPTPPALPTLLETAFSDQHEDMTWGIIGILLVVLGGLFAFLRSRWSHWRLRRQLGILERGYEMTRGRPRECRAFLADQRARARDLLLERKLTESQAALLERRIDECAGRLRLETVDARFDFVPHGLVRRIQVSLADGLVTERERRDVLALVDADRALSRTQKGRVRKLIEAWFAEDHAGAV